MMLQLPSDTGSQFRIKSVAKQAAYGGDPCEGSQHETQDCNTMACSNDISVFVLPCLGFRTSVL